MNFKLSKLRPTFVMAAATLAATALAVAAPRTHGATLAAPILLALSLVGTDVVERRRSGAGSRPSPASLFLAATVLLAGIVLSGDREALAAMLPILGTCAAMPFILRAEDARSSCRRA